MKMSLKTSVLTALLSVVLLGGVGAQETEGDAAPEILELSRIEAGAWSYFEGTRDEVEPRINDFLAAAEEDVAGLQPDNSETGRSLLGAVRDNLSAYLALLGEDELELQALPQPQLSYSLDDLLRIAAVSRAAADGAARERLEVEREQRVLGGASRRRDQAFKEYVDATAGDAKIIAGLRLIQTRSAQAISASRLRLLTQSHDRAKTYADAAARRVALASETLAIVPDEANLEGLIEQVAERQAAADAAREALRTAELEASSLDLEAKDGRSQQRLLQQRLIEAEVVVALTDLDLAKSQARRWWTELQVDTDPNLDELRDQALSWSKLIRIVPLNMPEWQQDSQDELLAVQTTDRSGLNRASRRLLDQRLAVAQETLARIGEAEDAVQDLELLESVVDRAVAESSGALSSWFQAASRQSQAAYQRVRGLADVTLFHVGETPVTGSDIFRVLIILLLAYLLSRGFRSAIKRVSDRDTTGNQASLYTLSRLTHYTIIIIAVFVALSSIGLDFSNLALVAGALSVGIGFGLQSIVSNFVSGLIILFEHTLRVGDYIELDTGLTGTVKAINVRSTLINTNDNIDIVVPNSEFVTARLTNWTLGERVLRVRIPFGVAYGSDKELVRKAAIEAAEEVSYTLTHIKRRKPDAWLVDFGDSSLNFLLTVWVNREGARRPTRTRAAYLWELESKLTEYGIEIPFPQRDLNLRSGWPGGVVLEPHDPAATDV
jgi:small-conductance mechanosensitive channel